MRHHSRRGFLRRTLGAAWTSATLLEQSVFRAAAARAQSTGAPSRLFDIEKVAEGVFAAVARPAALINCNAAIFVNAADVLVVDTHSKPSAAAALIAQLRKEVTPKPVRYLVNSHFHWDHTQGTAAYRKAAPNVQIMASSATRRLLAENGVQRLKESLEQTRQSLESMKQKAAAAAGEAKTFFARMAADQEAYLKEMQSYTPDLPTVTFDRTLVLQDKAHELHLVFRGRAHTAGDVAVWCPQKKVMATGDVLHGFFPYLGDAYPAEWPRTLYALAELDFQQVIGGHAGVQHSRDRLYHMAAYLDDITEQVRRGKRSGKSLSELQGSITPSTLSSLQRNGYGDFIMASNMKYRPQPPGTRPSDTLTDGVRANVAHVFAGLERG